MLSKKLVFDLALVSLVFLATAGLVEAQKPYSGYIDPSFIDFNLRSQTLETRINDCLQTSALKPSDAQSLKEELKAINATSNYPQEGRANAQLHSRLDRLAVKVDLKSLKHTAVSTSIADIAAKKSRIRTHLPQVSPIQSALIEKKLVRISTLETYLLSNQGGLTYWQRKKINADLDLLESQLASHRKISLLIK